MKKFAALVLVLIMCFSVSIGGTYASLNGATGALASDVFVAESNGAKIEIAEGARIKLLPGATANGSAIHIETGDDNAIVTLKFTVPTLNGEPVIDITGGNGWKETNGEFTKTLSAKKDYTLSDFSFVLDPRIDIEDGEMVVVENGVIKHLDWSGLSTGYIKIEATAGILSSAKN